MPGDIFTATGAKVFIGPSVTNATDTTGEFAALSWTEIGMVRSIGDYGDQSSIVSAAVIGDGRMRKAKGARDAGDFDLTVFPVADDTGQAALLAAESTYSNYGFKVVLPNRLNQGGTDQIDYFRGLVTSRRTNVGENDAIVTLTARVAVNSPIYTVAATAA